MMDKNKIIKQDYSNMEQTVPDKTLSTVMANYNHINNNNDNINQMMNSTNVSNNNNKSHINLDGSQISDEKKYIKKLNKNNDLNKSNENYTNEKISSMNRPLSKISLSSSHNLIPIKPKNKKNTLPINIILGIIQLILSITLVPVGCLILARQETLSNVGCGIFAGAFSSLAGVFGIINIKKAQTGFLAMSLICIASSILALSITSIAVVRDSNNLNREEATWGSASGGLLFVLIIHFFVSVFSVYFSTLKLCTRKNVDDPENVFVNSSIITKRKVEEYIKSITQSQQNMYYNPTIISNEKLSKNNMSKQTSLVGLDHTYPGQYPFMLIPAGSNKKIKMRPVYSSSLLLAPNCLPTNLIPSEYNNSRYNNQRSIHRDVKRQKSVKEKSKERKKRRKSEGDLNIKEAAITYNGLDRDIAESFLMQQEKNNSINESKHLNSDVAL